MPLVKLEFLFSILRQRLTLQPPLAWSSLWRPAWSPGLSQFKVISLWELWAQGEAGAAQVLAQLG